MVLDGLYALVKGWGVQGRRIVLCVPADDEWYTYPVVVEDNHRVPGIVKDHWEEKVHIEEDQPVLMRVKTLDAKEEENVNHHAEAN